GMTFPEFACLARCNGLTVTSVPGDTVTLPEFLRDVQSVTSGDGSTQMVVSFSRKTLGQTGDGHFSPIGAYHAGSGQALVLDVARFKYPSYFVEVEKLWEAMRPVDKETGMPRGYFLLRKQEREGRSIPLARVQRARASPLLAMAGRALASGDKEEVLRQLVEPFGRRETSPLVFGEVGVDLASEEEGSMKEHLEEDIGALVCGLKSSALYTECVGILTRAGALKSGEELRESASLATLFVAAMPRTLVRKMDEGLRSKVDGVAGTGADAGLVREEVARLLGQLESLSNVNCGCSKKACL
ncbi:hypothetical protein HK101_000167, partial [Irineochytrium annulatum]